MTVTRKEVNLQTLEDLPPETMRQIAIRTRDFEDQLPEVANGNSGIGVMAFDPPKVATAVPEPKQYSISVFDADNPRALINIVTTEIAGAIRKVAEDRPELLEMDERSLGNLLKPSPTDNRIRVGFWNEYMLAQDHGKKLFTQRIYAGVCTHEFFLQGYVKNVEKMAWLLCPPSSYSTAITEALLHGIGRMRDVLELPLIDAKGNTIPSNVNAIIRAVQMLDQRAKGGIIQRIEAKTQTYSVNHQINQESQKPAETLEEINERIKELEQKSKSLRSPGSQAIEVQGGEVDGSTS